jgi:hypothetical protein
MPTKLASTSLAISFLNVASNPFALPTNLFKLSFTCPANSPSTWGFLSAAQNALNLRARRRVDSSRSSSAVSFSPAGAGTSGSEA